MRYLTPHLKGKALSQYSALDEDSDYDEVKLAIDGDLLSMQKHIVRH